ncbi:hypothetical protein EVJ27_06925 [Exiguobacterium sp. SH3S2]|uniref:oligosaccharide flippase family protein n=2 Tax=Exiguobacterium TaxID=33986 RepID=UPI00103D1E98|nr:MULTISPECIES: oligosaccharide flippase family protein [unclassified Exiguobacterium]TCI46216.1 hypothetical protein EVJ28_06920 [Exiguobacterium sp. SH3S3]TCI61304.1 hypothetical protein EVJ27_06925 [Exiguobacterium sp. SH3S2]
MNRNKELFFNTILFAIGNFGSKFILFLLVPLYTLTMTAEEFGTVDLIQTGVYLIWPILSLGISESVMRFIITNKNARSEALLLGLLIVFISGLLTLIAASVLNKVEIFENYAYLFSFLYIVIATKNILSQFCRGIEKILIYSIDGIVSALTLTISSIVFLYFMNLGINGYLYAIIISNLISILFLFIYCEIIKYLFTARINKILFKDMIFYSLPLLPNTLSWWIIQTSDKYILSFFSGVLVVGLYSMAYKIPSIFNLIVSVFMQAWQLIAIKELEEDKGGSYFSSIYKYYVAVTFISSSIIILSTRPIASLIFKNDFYDSWKFIPLLMVAFTIGNLQAFYGSIYTGVKKTTKVFISTLIGAIVNIILNFILIPSAGVYGALVATIASYFIIYLYRLNDVQKYLLMDHATKKISISLILLCLLAVFYGFDYMWTDILSVVLGFLLILIYSTEICEIAKKIYHHLVGLISNHKP